MEILFFLTITIVFIMLMIIKTIDVINNKKHQLETKESLKAIINLLAFQNTTYSKTVLEVINEELRKLNDL